MAKPSECGHQHWVVRGKDPVGLAWCEDCCSHQHLATLFNRLHDRMEWILRKIEKSQPKEK